MPKLSEAALRRLTALKAERDLVDTKIAHVLEGVCLALEISLDLVEGVDFESGEILLKETE